MVSPKRKLAVGLVIHLFLLVTCAITVVVMTATRSFVQLNYSTILVMSLVSIADLNIQPDLSVAVHVLLLALGMFIPSVTGLFWTCNKRKSLKIKIRIVHFVVLVVGIVVVCVLIFSQGASLPENVDCRYIYNSCYCGIYNFYVSSNVCTCRDLRVVYFALLIVGLIVQLVSLGVVAKLRPLTCSCGSVRVSPDSADSTANRTNTQGTAENSTRSDSD